MRQLPQTINQPLYYFNVKYTEKGGGKLIFVPVHKDSSMLEHHIDSMNVRTIQSFIGSIKWNA